ncbi:response regulator [Oerskovia jenensis]|uniref:CheY-like chemotaxis protein n=1 Tax=Oerskovia jenensis TaxID=162169 RepID=A0ABS2LBE6_9CELL|nr:response regulator [Oerskovia jenensis]MBM7477741.1 CheY-like chemotaxis protein [Oerskovia jenensis]
MLSPEDLLRVLLVEDDDGDAILVEELLDDARVKVELHRARSLDVALEMLRLHDVHCVLLDLGLPDAVGLSAVERLQSRPDPPALVVLTGHTGIDLGVQAVAAGADDYLVKGAPTTTWSRARSTAICWGVLSATPSSAVAPRSSSEPSTAARCAPPRPPASSAPCCPSRS